MSKQSKPKPITGVDLHALRERHQLRIYGLAWLVGAPQQMVSKLLSAEKEDEPLSITRALLVRVLQAYPEALPIPKPISPEEMYNLLAEIDPSFSPKALGALAGRQGMSGYRWLHGYQGSGVSADVESLFIILRRILTGEEGELRADASERFKKLQEIVETEAVARDCDLDTLLNEHKWSCGKKEKK